MTEPRVGAHTVASRRQSTTAGRDRCLSSRPSCRRQARGRVDPLERREERRRAPAHGVARDGDGVPRRRQRAQRGSHLSPQPARLLCHACVRRAVYATAPPRSAGRQRHEGSERSSLFVNQSRAELLPRTMSTTLFVSGRAATKNAGRNLLLNFVVDRAEAKVETGKDYLRRDVDSEEGLRGHAIHVSRVGLLPSSKVVLSS